MHTTRFVTSSLIVGPIHIEYTVVNIKNKRQQLKSFKNRNNRSIILNKEACSCSKNSMYNIGANCNIHTNSKNNQLVLKCANFGQRHQIIYKTRRRRFIYM